MTEKYPDLDRQKIREVDDLPLTPFAVEGWKGTIYIQALNGIERDEWEDRFLKMNDSGKITLRGMRAEMIIKKSFNSEGSPLFQKGDKDWLIKKNGDVLIVIFDKILKLSGMDVEAQKDAEKNSVITPADSLS